MILSGRSSEQAAELDALARNVRERTADEILQPRDHRLIEPGVGATRHGREHRNFAASRGDAPVEVAVSFFSFLMILDHRENRTCLPSSACTSSASGSAWASS